MTSWLTSGRPRQFMLMWANRRCSILFHLLVPGGKWHTVTASPVVVGEALQLDLPQPHPIAVAAAAVGADQQPLRPGIGVRPDRLPPAAQARDREARRVVVLPHGDPAGVAAHIVDAVGDRLAQLLVGEVVDVDLLGLALRLPLPPAVLEVARPAPSSWCPPRRTGWPAAGTP